MKREDMELEMYTKKTIIIRKMSIIQQQEILIAMDKIKITKEIEIAIILEMEVIKTSILINRMQAILEKVVIDISGHE